jgi:hypothetical protein
MIVFYLCIKVIPLDAIHDDLVPTLGAEVVVSFKVTEKARSANFVPNND